MKKLFKIMIVLFFVNLIVLFFSTVSAGLAYGFNTPAPTFLNVWYTWTVISIPVIVVPMIIVFFEDIWEVIKDFVND